MNKFTRYKPEELVERVLRNVRGRERHSDVRWHVVGIAFGMGSTYSIELCRAYDLDPDEQIAGVPEPEDD